MVTCTSSIHLVAVFLMRIQNRPFAVCLPWGEKLRIASGTIFYDGIEIKLITCRVNDG